MNREPVSPFRGIYILALLMLRRWINRLSGGFAASFRRKKPGTTGRLATTAAKKKRNFAMLLFFGSIFLFNSVNISTQAVARLANDIAPAGLKKDGSVELYSPSQHRVKEKFDSNFKDGKEIKYLIPSKPGDNPGKNGLNKNGKPGSLELNGKPGSLELNGKPGSLELKKRPVYATFPSTDIWPGKEHELPFVSALALLLIILFVSLMFISIGGRREEIGKVEWHMMWFFTFPVKSWILFFGKLFAMSVANAFAWLTAFPFLFTIFVCAGYRIGSLPLAFISTLYFNLLLASVRLLTETWLRKNCAPGRLRNLQALFGLLGTFSLMGVFYIAFSKTTPEIFLSCARGISSLLLFIPPCEPVIFCIKNNPAWVPVCLMSALGFAAASGSVLGAQHMVRNGLIAETGSYRGVRRNGGPDKGSKGGFKGIIGKDLLLLVRDRTLLVSSLVVPVIVIGMQIIINPNLLKTVGGDFRHLTALGFGVGAYALISSAFCVVAVEGKTLWLLYTFPRHLSEIISRKALIWGCLCCMYPLVVFCIALFGGTHFELSMLLGLFFAVAGVFVCAFIASGIGVMATDPFAPNPRRSIRIEFIYFYMFLCALYAYTLYAPSLWNKFVTFVLFVSLAIAMWQKTCDVLPFLLDPVSSPKSRIGASDGLTAALFFFVLQGIVLTICIAEGSLSHGAQVLVAYTVSGFIVTIVTLYIFWRKKVEDLALSIGLKGKSGEKISLLKSIGTGLICGLGAAIFAMLYIWAINFIEPLRDLKEKSMRLNALEWKGAVGYFVILAVFAAPLFEEYLFRGLLFNGLRRSMNAWWAVLVSSALFAVVHPPVSVIPVFVLGIAAAAAFLKTRFIITPIVTHMVYNAVVICVNLVLH